MTYPTPASSHAQIWVDGDDIYLLCPGDVRGHTVKQPYHEAILRNLCADTKRLDVEERRTLRAIGAIFQVLRERAQASMFTIGHASAPTQSDLNEIMKALNQGRVTRVEPKIRADDSLTLEDLEL